MERPPPSPSSSPIPVPAPTTTFVQTDQSTFKELVQRLTGPTSTSTRPGTSISTIELQHHQQQQQQQQSHHLFHHQYHSTPPSPTGKPPAGIIKRRPAFKAQGYRPKLTILKPGPVNPVLFAGPGVISPSSEVASLSIRDNDRSPSPSVELNEEAEEKAIKERRFYLHPSPRSRESMTEPELLTLFPLSSPGSSNQS
ncbi:VQ motif-containing protein [Rhynchospora pubera]|uniref:VQ motif-containing protein n=1 Tax=Rhynchospora pubera TaxID=906938 RepID=A0AAV8C7W9_9POAL|nr:VQ motif-containing protein [Rhynchospora pubera]